MTQYMVHARRETSGDGHIAIRSRADLDSSFSSLTDIVSSSDSGLDAGTTDLRFGQLIRDEDSSNWYCFFSSEETGPPMKIYRAESSNSDPTVAGSWGTITKLLSPSNSVGTYDEDGVAGPFVFRYKPGLWMMLFSGLDESVRASGEWTVGIATATAIDGTWTKYGSNPIIDTSTGVVTQINGADSDRTKTVDSTSGFAVGDPVIIGADGSPSADDIDYRPTRVRKINSSTEFEFWHKLNAADNHYVVKTDFHSVHARSIRRSLDSAYDWELWATVFRMDADGGDKEVVGKFVGTGQDPRTATWVLSRDDGYPWVGLPYLGGSTPSQDYDATSSENIGHVWDKRLLIPPVSAPPVPPGRHAAVTRRLRM